MSYKEINQKCYDKSSIFILSISGFILLCFWAFFEASFWFIAPDFLIFLYCLVSPKSHRKYILIALIASILGGLFYYYLNLNYFDSVNQIFVNTPYVSEANVNFVQNLFSGSGVGATFFQAITLIPFKIWTHLAFLQGLNPVLYFIFVGISRLFRFYIVALMGVWFSKKFKNQIRNNFLLVLCGYIILFLLVMQIMEVGL